MSLICNFLLNWCKEPRTPQCQLDNDGFLISPMVTVPQKAEKRERNTQYFGGIPVFSYSILNVG